MAETIEKPKVEDIVDQYIKLRARKAARKAAYDADVAEIDRMLDKVENYLLGRMTEDGVDSYKTAAGTAYTQTKTSANVGDWDMLLPFIRDNELWNMLERRVSKTAVEEYRQAHDDLPPGINWRAEKVVNIRRT